MQWVKVTSDDVKAVGLGIIIDKAASTATGSVDPVTEEIANATARVRRAVASGNDLDIDPETVPPSLKGLTARMVFFGLCDRLAISLKEDQRDTRRNDHSDLLRIADRKIRVEAPDNPDVAATPENRGNWNSHRKVLGRMHPVPAPARQHPGPGYANSDGLKDASE